MPIDNPKSSEFQEVPAPAIGGVAPLSGQEGQLTEINLDTLGQSNVAAKPTVTKNETVTATPAFDYDFVAESGRIGLKNATRGLSNSLLAAVPWMGGLEGGLATVLSGGMALGPVMAGNQLLRWANPDFANRQDAQAKRGVDELNRWSDSAFGAYPNAPLLKPLDGIQDLADAQRITNLVLEQGPLMGAQLLAYIANPILGTALTTAIEGGEAKSALMELEAQGHEIDPIHKDLIPQVVGIVNAALELAGAEPLLRLASGEKYLRSRLFNVALGMITEPLTEGAQTLVTETGVDIAEVGDTREAFQGLVDDGLDPETIYKVKDAMLTAIVLSGVAGGSLASLDAMVGEKNETNMDKVSKAISDELAYVNERENLSRFQVDAIRKAMHDGSLEGDSEPINLQEYMQNIQNGVLPVYSAMPKFVADTLPQGTTINSPKEFIDILYEFGGLDPLTLDATTRAYIENDAQVRFAEAIRLGVGFNTKNIAGKWGKFYKSVAEEFIRRVAVVAQTNNDASKIPERDRITSRPTLGEPVVLGGTVRLTSEQQSNFLQRVTEAQQDTKSLHDAVYALHLKLDYDADPARIPTREPVTDVAATSEVPSTVSRATSGDRTPSTVQFTEVEQDNKEGQNVPTAAFPAIQSTQTTAASQPAQQAPSVVQSTPVFKPTARRTQQNTSPRNPDGYTAGPAGTQQLIDPGRQPDVLPYVHKLMTPVFALRHHPRAQVLAQLIVDGELSAQKQTERAYSIFDRIAKKVRTKQNRIAVRKAMELLSSGNATLINQLQRTNPKVYEAAVELREWFDTKREEIKQYKRLMFQLQLPEKQAKAAEAVLSGNMILPEAAAYYGVDPIKLGRMLEEYAEIDNWGIDNYIPNAMVGSYTAVDETGQVRVVAPTRAELEERVVQFFKENPNVTTLTIADQLDHPALETPMSKRAYQVLNWRLAKELNKTTNKINARLAREAARQAVRTVAKITPDKKFSKFFAQRKGVLRGEEDVFDILYSYAHSVAVKTTLDPIIHVVNEQLHTFAPNVQQVLKEQVEDAKGRYNPIDKFVDAVFTRLGSGGRPLRATRFVGQATKITAYTNLGYRPIAGLINKLSGEMHVWAKVGTRYAIRAKFWMRTAEGEAFIKGQETLGELGNTFTGASMHDLSFIHPMYFFNKPESGMRKYGLAANYLLAKDLGYNQEHAEYFARQAMHTQLFLYNTAAIPRVLRNPAGRLIGQFRSYLVQELQFVAALNPQEFVRYAAGMLVIGGLRGAVALAMSLPLIGAVIGWERLDEYLNKEWPRLSRGFMGFLKGDITTQSWWQLPTSVEDLAGAFLSKWIKLYQNVIQPQLQGTGDFVEDTEDWLNGIVIAWRNFTEMLDAVISEDGWVRDTQGNPAWHIDNKFEYLQLALGIQPLGKSQQAVAERYYMNNIRRSRILYEKEMNRYVKMWHKAQGLEATARKLEKYLEDGGTLPLQIVNAMAEYAVKTHQVDSADIDRLVLYGMTSGDVLSARLQKSYMSPADRRFEEARLLEKLQALGAFDLEYGSGQ